MRRLLAWTMTVVILVSAIQAQAVVISLVGDRDGFGFDSLPDVPADGTDVPYSGFDHRTVDDPVFTDYWGYEQDDGELGSPVTYTHSYLLPDTTVWAVLDIQTAGMADDRGPWRVDFNSTTIGLIPSTAGGLEILMHSFSVPTGLLTGNDQIELVYLDDQAEGFAINFSELRIEGTGGQVPDASVTLYLLGTALLGLTAVRQRI